MLLHMKSHIQAMRVLAYTTAKALDLASHAPDVRCDAPTTRHSLTFLRQSPKRGAPTVPVNSIHNATQVFGGMGYIEETGVAQYERDVRITTIYEGTNGIQAIDLVDRKIGVEGGKVVDGVIGVLETCVPHWIQLLRRTAYGSTTPP